MTKLVIYDLDGTIVDSLPLVSKILNDIRISSGKSPITKEAFFPWISMGSVDLVANVLEIPLANAEHELIKFRDVYSKMITPSSSLYPEIYDTLVQLTGQMNLKLSICTNKPRKLAEKVLADLGIARFFPFMNAGGDFPNKKPAIENVYSCLQYFSIEPHEAIYVGDSRVDQELALKAGIPFVHYRAGYDDGVDPSFSLAGINGHLELVSLITG